MKKVVIIALMLLISAGVLGQDLELDNDIFQTEHKQKNAQKAMLFSALIPGVGQFYANPKAITAYIFPVLEFGLWYGYVYYKNEGDDITKQYEDFADQNYNRDNQYQIQEYLIIHEDSDDNFYDGHFRLDHENTQHFYEDIGKYDKYIFGWNDWTDIYARNPGQSWLTSPSWEFEEGKLSDVAVKNFDSDYYLGSEELYDYSRGEFSAMRAEYIQMRRDAEDQYDLKRYCSFGIIINHLLATIDAVRVTRRYNIEHISQNDLDLKFAPRYTDGEFKPGLMLSYSF